MNINLTTLLFIYREIQLEVLVALNIFVGEWTLETSPHLVATDLNRQVEDIFTVLKFIFSIQGNSFTVMSFFEIRIYCCMHTA